MMCAMCNAGYEPRRLFNVVEFLMNDKDDSGSVSVEEAMQILYLRFGKGLLDSVRAQQGFRESGLGFRG
jgi:calmodulin